MSDDERSYLTSGSAIERALHCTASMALPHADHTTIHTERGTVIHTFLEDVCVVGRETALECVPDDYREVCDALNLDGLDVQLSLAPEVAIAYDVLTDSARELGRGEGRKYDDVGLNEIPCTLDVVGIREVPRGRRGLVIDWKTGWTTARNSRQVLQLDFGGLATARAYGCDVVEVQLVHVREDVRPWVQRRTLSGLEIDAFAAEVQQAHASAVELRKRLIDGAAVPSWKTGPWCEHCPSWQWCPAQMNLVRNLLSGDEFDQVLRTQPIPERTLAYVWDRIAEAKRTLARLTGIIRGAALAKPIKLGELPSGEVRWLGLVMGEGNDKLDGDKAYAVLADQLGTEVADAATKRTATKKDITAAIKNAVPKGRGAKTMAAFLAELKVRGGVANKISSNVEEWTAKPGTPQAPALPATAPKPLELATGTPGPSADPFDAAP